MKATNSGADNTFYVRNATLWGDADGRMTPFVPWYLADYEVYLTNLDAIGQIYTDVLFLPRLAYCPGASASTRSGLPEPFTILRGGAITIAPVGGNWSRLVRLAKPYLLAPCIKV